MMDKVHARSRSMVPLALKRLQGIIDLPPLPPDDPHAPALQDLKRGAKTALCRWLGRENDVGRTNDD
jgi:hypothetical protein